MKKQNLDKQAGQKMKEKFQPDGEIEITQTLSSTQLDQAATLLLETFPEKILPYFKSQQKLINMIKKSIIPEMGFYALYKDKIVGIIGIYEEGRQFINLRFSILKEELPLFKAIPIYIVYKFAKSVTRIYLGKFSLDPVAVHKDFRRMKIGTRLMKSITQYGIKKGYPEVRLFVIEPNTMAQAFYEKCGFVNIKTVYSGFLTRREGYTKSFLMVKKLL